MRRTTVPALALALTVSAAVPAFAGTVSIKNCTDEKRTVCIYNGGDTVMMVARSRRTLPPGTEWSPKCKGDGHDRCKAYLVKEAGNACPVNAKSGKVYRLPFNSHSVIEVIDDEQTIVVGDRLCRN